MDIIAITAVVFSSFSVAYLTIRKEIKHCKHLSLILRFIASVKNCALFYNAPFAEIINQLKNDDNFNKFDFFDYFSENLSSGMSVPDAWRDAIINADIEIDDKERDILIRFGTDMCRCNKVEINEISDQIISEISELRNEAVEKRNTKSKSTAAVTVSTGILIVLIFV